MGFDSYLDIVVYRILYIRANFVDDYLIRTELKGKKFVQNGNEGHQLPKWKMSTMVTLPLDIIENIVRVRKK